MGDRKEMDEVDTFLLKKLNDAIPNVKPSNNFLWSDCLCNEFIHLRNRIADDKNEINPVTRKEKLYLLNNLIAEWQMILNKHNPCAPQTIMSAINIRGSLKNIKSELETGTGSVLEEAEGGQHGKPSIEIGKWNSHSVDPTKIYGIEDESMVMERLLVGKERKDGFEAFGIVGVSGVGKTAFCQVAFNNPEVRKYFAPRLWVYLSKKPEGEYDYKKEVVKSILMCLGYEEKLIDEIGADESIGLLRLLLALRLKLKGKKYLIVLDGVWTSDEKLVNFCSSLTRDDKDQDQLAYGLPKGDGGTVIVMSRSKKLAAVMVGEKNLHRLVPPVDDESCWKIFLDTVGKETEYLKNLKAEIVKRCYGVPLVANMLGQIVLQELQSSTTSSLPS